MIGRSSIPLAQLVAGPLTDTVFESLLLPGGALSASVGSLIGVGSGAARDSYCRLRACSQRLLHSSRIAIRVCRRWRTTCRTWWHDSARCLVVWQSGALSYLARRIDSRAKPGFPVQLGGQPLLMIRSHARLHQALQPVNVDRRSVSSSHWTQHL